MGRHLGSGVAEAQVGVLVSHMHCAGASRLSLTPSFADGWVWCRLLLGLTCGAYHCFIASAFSKLSFSFCWKTWPSSFLLED